MDHTDTKELPENIKWFLRGLADLSNRHKISVDGCGCCGSPFLIGEGTDRYIVDELKFNDKEYQFSWARIPTDAERARSAIIEAQASYEAEQQEQQFAEEL